MAKESLIHIDKDVIFRETFNSGADVIANGGTPTDVTFSNGVGAFNGSSSKILYPYKLSGTYTIRIRFKEQTPVAGKYICDFRGDGGVGYFWRSSTTLVASSSGTIYVDGVATTAYNSNSKEFVVSGITIDSNGSGYIGCFNSGATGFITADYDLIDIYNRTLTAEEVSALYSNILYTAPSLRDAVLHIPIISSIYDTEGNTITNTGVEVVRDGSKDVMRFCAAAATCNLQTPAISVSAGTSYTYSMWANIKSAGEGGYGRLFDHNDILEVYSRTGGTDLTIIGGSTARLASSFVDYNKWTKVDFVYQSAGSILLYKNGSLFDTLAVNVIVNDSEILSIGANASLNRGLDGNIKDFKILSTAWTAEQVARDYNSSKQLYGY